MSDNRKSIICIRGHVDTGKTSFIDKLSSHNTEVNKKNLTKSEAGGITQQVGTTTFIKEHLIKFIPNHLKDKFNMDFVTIDTPGHTDFENIRKIGTSIAHIILVFVDIVKGIDTDTLEFIESNVNYDKMIIVLNKIDKIYGFKPVGHANIKKMMNKQTKEVNSQIEEYYRLISRQLSDIGIYADLYYNKKIKECLAMIPISAHTGDGIPDLLLYMSNVKMSLEVNNSNVGYILDKRAGKQIIGIMKYGEINKNNSIKIGSNIFPIKNLMRTVGYSDSRENKFELIDSVSSAISFSFKVDDYYDYIELGSEFEVIDDIICEINEVKINKELDEIGIHIIIPSESMLSGICEHLKNEKIPVNSYSIGNISKIELMRYSNKKFEPSNYYNRYKAILICQPEIVDSSDQTILLKEFFDADKIHLIESSNIKIIFGGTIYKLASLFNEYLKQIKLNFVSNYGAFSEFEAEVIPKFIFRTSDPIICGVKIKKGCIKIGSEVISDNKYYGKVSGIQLDTKDIQIAKTDMEVCLKIVGGNDNLAKGININLKNKENEFSKLVVQDIIDTNIEKQIIKINNDEVLLIKKKDKKIKNKKL